MNIPRILLKGKFYESDILVTLFKESNRKISPLIETKIENIWNQKKEKAEKLKTPIWDSATYRLNDYFAKDNQLNISLGEISFKTRNCIKEIPELFTLDEDYLGKGCFVTALVKTKDNKYVFGVRNSENFKLTTIGGVLSKDETPVKEGSDIFKAIYLELYEEIGINKINVDNCVLIGLLYSSGGNIGFIFNINLNIESNKLEQLFRKRTDNELKNYKLVSESDLSNVLNSMGDYWKEIVKLI